MGTSESFKSTTIVGLLAFSVVALLAITSLAVFDRAPHAAASVGGRMVVDETLVLYFATTSPTSTALKPDLENPVGNDAVISYGEVTLDTDGAILTESPRVAIYVRNISDGPIELTVERDASLDSEPLNGAELVRALFGPMGGEISSAPSYATRIEAGELYAADLGIGFSAPPGTSTLNFSINFTAEPITANDVAIACEAGSRLCSGSSSAAFLIKQVLEGEGKWTAVDVVDGSSIDTQGELERFAVLIIGGTRQNGPEQDYVEYQDAINAWVRSGGGLVATGMALHDIYIAVGPSPTSSIAEILPVTPNTSNYCCAGRVRITDRDHPLTANMADFDFSHYIGFDKNPKPGAQVLALDTIVGEPAIVAWRFGEGRVVYLSPAFYTSYADYPDNRLLLDGVIPAARRAFVQAVMWASGINPDKASGAPAGVE